MDRYETLKLETKENEENKKKEIKEKDEKKEIEDIEEERKDNNLKLKDKILSSTNENNKCFRKNSIERNYYKKLNHTVLGSIAEVQKENKANIENNINKYVVEYSKQFDDMTFRKKDRKYEFTTKEYKDNLVKMRQNILKLNP